MKKIWAVALTVFLLAGSAYGQAAQDKFVVPDQKIVGIEDVIPLGELVILQPSVIADMPKYLTSVSYKWVILDGGKVKLRIREEADGSLTFGGGVTPKTMTAILSITYTYLVKDDKGAVSEVSVKNKLVVGDVIIGSGPGPPVGTFAINAADGSTVSFSPNTDLDAAKRAADIYASTHPGVKVTVTNSTGVSVYVAFVDPTPVDPLAATLQAAYNADTDGDKAKSVAFLSGLYKAIGAIINDPSFTTPQSIMDRIHQAEDVTGLGLAKTAIPKVRAALGTELNAKLPKKNVALTQADRDVIGKEFLLIAKLLGGLK